MHPTEELLAGRQRRQIQTRAASIWEAVGDGSGDYRCLLDTGLLVRASVEAAGVTFQKYTPVMLTRTDDGTLATSSGWIIKANRPFTALGSAFALPTSGDLTHPGAAIEMIDLPALAFFRGDTYGFSVYGVGLENIVLSTSSADTYGTADLTDAAVPIVTPTRMTFSIHADVAAAYGAFDLTLGDLVFPRFFLITA